MALVGVGVTLGRVGVTLGRVGVTLGGVGMRLGGPEIAETGESTGMGFAICIWDRRRGDAGNVK
jgi:hypothetical protein